MISSRVHQNVFTHSSRTECAIVLGRIVFLHLLSFSPPLNIVEELHLVYETVIMMF